jgi:hypothetical protein
VRAGYSKGIEIPEMTDAMLRWLAAVRGQPRAEPERLVQGELFPVQEVQADGG